MSRIVPLAAATYPQCKAERKGKYVCDKPGAVYQCCNRAKYIVDGTPLCGKHAGVVALRIMTEGQTPMQVDATLASMIDKHTTGVKV